MNEKCKLSAWVKGCSALSGKTEPTKSATCDCGCCLSLSFSMLLISAFCIGIGLLAIIGANWHMIPSAVKIIFYIALLAINIYWLKKASKTAQNKLKEALLIVLAIMLMIGINLIADVFGLTVQFYDKILIWCILASPLLFLTKKSLLGCFWIPLLWLSLTALLSRFETTAWLIDTIHLQAPGVIMWAIAFILLLISAKTATSSFGRAARFWFCGTIVLTLLANEILQDVGFYSYGVFLRDLLFTPSEYCWIYWVVCAIALSAFIYSDKQSAYNGSIIALMIMILFNYIAAYTPLIFIPNFGLMAAICTLAILITALVRATEQNRNRLCKLLLGLIALRIILICNQDFGSLALTGLGLICAGIVFVWVAKRISLQNQVLPEKSPETPSAIKETPKEPKRVKAPAAKSKATAKKAPAPKKKVVKQEKKTTKK